MLFSYLPTLSLLASMALGMPVLSGQGELQSSSSELQRRSLARPLGVKLHHPSYKYGYAIASCICKKIRDWEKGSRLNFEKLPYDDQKKLELDWEYDCEKLTWDNFEQQKMRQRQESERKSGQTKSQFDKGENEGGQRTSGPTAGVGVGNFKDTASANESGFFGAAGAVAAATATAGAAGGAIVNGVNNVARTAGRVWAPLGSALTGNQY